MNMQGDRMRGRYYELASLLPAAVLVDLAQAPGARDGWKGGQQGCGGSSWRSAHTLHMVQRVASSRGEVAGLAGTGVSRATQAALPPSHIPASHCGGAVFFASVVMEATTIRQQARLALAPFQCLGSTTGTTGSVS